MTLVFRVCGESCNILPIPDESRGCEAPDEMERIENRVVAYEQTLSGNVLLTGGFPLRTLSE